MRYLEVIWTPEQSKELDYYSELQRISDTMKLMFIDFPFEFCNLTARVVKEVIGLEELAGNLIDFHSKKILALDNWHAWNYDPARNIHICLTFRQYDFAAPDISIFPETSSVFIPRSDYTGFQKKVDLIPYGLQDVLDELKK